MELEDEARIGLGALTTLGVAGMDNSPPTKGLALLETPCGYPGAVGGGGCTGNNGRWLGRNAYEGTLVYLTP